MPIPCCHLSHTHCPGKAGAARHLGVLKAPGASLQDFPQLCSMQRLSWLREQRLALPGNWGLLLGVLGILAAGFGGLQQCGCVQMPNSCSDLKQQSLASLN